MVYLKAIAVGVLGGVIFGVVWLGASVGGFWADAFRKTVRARNAMAIIVLSVTGRPGSNAA